MFSKDDDDYYAIKIYSFITLMLAGILAHALGGRERVDIVRTSSSGRATPPWNSSSNHTLFGSFSCGLHFSPRARRVQRRENLDSFIALETSRLATFPLSRRPDMDARRVFQPSHHISSSLDIFTSSESCTNVIIMTELSKKQKTRVEKKATDGEIDALPTYLRGKSHVSAF